MHLANGSVPAFFGIRATAIVRRWSAFFGKKSRFCVAALRPKPRNVSALPPHWHSMSGLEISRNARTPFGDMGVFQD
jgi:hypothetical protein